MAVLHHPVIYAALSFYIVLLKKLGRNKYEASLTRRAMMAGLTALSISLGIIGTAVAADKITVGAPASPHIQAACRFRKGYFTEQGLEVEFKFFQAAQPMAVAIASGDVDFGVTLITADWSIRRQGRRVIGGVLQEEKGIDGSAISPEQPHEAGLTSPDNQGRSLGINQTGSSFHYMASQVAAKEGFDISEISLKPLQKVGAIIGALKSGQIDALIIVQHID